MEVLNSTVFFNSTTKTLINSEFTLDKSFQEILYRIDNCINDESSWIVESIDDEYLNTSAYSPLVGSTYTELPDELKNQMKGLINIKNNDNKCFLWCHIKHLNLVQINPRRITRKDRELVNKLDYEGINFPVSKKNCCRIEMQNKIYINAFCYDNKFTYFVFLSDQRFSDNMDLLLISNHFKSHFVYIKDFDRFMFNKTKNRNKHFCKCCLQCFTSKEILIEHKKDCLVINGKQSVKFKSSSIRFKNYSKQIPVPFKIYVDSEYILKKVDCDITECNSNILIHKKISRSYSLQF